MLVTKLRLTAAFVGSPRRAGEKCLDKNGKEDPAACATEPTTKVSVFYVYPNIHRVGTSLWNNLICTVVTSDAGPRARFCVETGTRQRHSSSFYMLRPHPEWEQYGLPATGADIFQGDPYLNIERHFEINVGALYAHIWFPCDMPPDQPKQIITMNIGPETHAGAEIEWTVSDFDVLVPDNGSSESY